MKSSVLNKLAILIFLFAFSISQVHAQSNTETGNAALRVTSDKMIALKDSSMVEFIGNVKATRLDSIVHADSIQIFFNQKSESASTDQNNVKKIVSTGNVRYIGGERKAFADKAVYTTNNDTLILTGKAAKLVTGSSFVTGKKITLIRSEDKVIVESDGNNRVQALFNPEDTPKENQ